MTCDEMSIFVCSYSDFLTNNIELCEFRNGALFAIMNSDNLALFLSTLKNQKSYIPRIFSASKSGFTVSYMFSVTATNKGYLELTFLRF